ncbi:hypothetical protein RJ640_007440 [Escallonia rubra]|uniref:Uncharacterized protein n=1 Tax=Escallonia rubra TaxID=112253 RepID=A0AA88S4A0_9ASTE|nr:hypothetical protein RJ640_007440 [Escallonia rubra]
MLWFKGWDMMAGIKVVDSGGYGRGGNGSVKLVLCGCFTRMVLSMWAMTMLSLYIRVQVNILGRHLYIETARDIGASDMLVRAILLFMCHFSAYSKASSLCFGGVVSLCIIRSYSCHSSRIFSGV